MDSLPFPLNIAAGALTAAAVPAIGSAPAPAEVTAGTLGDPPPASATAPAAWAGIVNTIWLPAPRRPKKKDTPSRQVARRQPRSDRKKLLDDDERQAAHDGQPGPARRKRKTD